jgi:transketolase
MAKATRQAFGEALVRLGEKHPEIVVLDADLSKSTKSDLFAKKFPDRFFEMGIAEANMIGTAAGMSFAGKLPFLCSFGAFVTGRFDTIRLSVAYSEANVRIVGTHAGVGIGDDGHSQMGLEDVALMRTLPKMGVFQPMDAAETEALMDYLVTQWKGPAYIRLTRQSLPDHSPDYSAGTKFNPLKLLQLKTGRAIALIGSGAGTAEAMKASEILAKEGIQASVWNACSLKPFDAETLRAIASQNQWIATVEDHSVIGGLGSAVAEVLSELDTTSARLKRFGIQDQFGESGDPAALYEKHGISGEKIAKTVAQLL